MSEEHWTWSCDRSIANDPRAGRGIVEEVLGQLKAHRWRPHEIFGVHLALEEALANAMTHGNHCDPCKQVHVRCRLSPRLVRIEIADEGEGFNHCRVPDPTEPDRLEFPSGRGLMLMRAFMNRVEYNDRGNRVVLEKRRDD